MGRFQIIISRKAGSGPHPGVGRLGPLGRLGSMVAAMAATAAAIGLVVAALVLYGINEYLGRQMIAPLEAKGIDIERLHVE